MICFFFMQKVNNFSCGERFEVGNLSAQHFRRKDHVDMVFHDHVSVEGYSVVTLKIGQRFEKDVGNSFAPEQGQPVDCRAGDEVGISFFNNFVAASAHMVHLCLSGAWFYLRPLTMHDD